MAYSTFVLVPGDITNYEVPRIANPADIVAHLLNPYGGQLNPNPPTPPNQVIVAVSPSVIAGLA